MTFVSFTIGFSIWSRFLGELSTSSCAPIKSAFADAEQPEMSIELQSLSGSMA